MMTTMLVIKSRIKDFYEKHYRITHGVFQGILAFLSLLIISRTLNYNDTLGNVGIIFGVSVICGCLPNFVTILVSFLYLCGEIAQVSPLLAVTILLVLIIFFLLFGKMNAKVGAVVLAIPLFSALNMGAMIPIVVGLFLTPTVLPALAMGVLLQYMLEGISNYVVAVMGTSAQGDVLASLQYLFDDISKNAEMLVMIVAYVLAFFCTYMVRRSKIKNGMQFSILTGGLVLMAVVLLGNIIIDLKLNFWGFILQIVLSMGLSLIIQFFHMTLDYHGTKKLQFEDDEYYYYVTAVPKMKVAVVDKTVTRIVPEEEEVLDLKEELEKALEEEELEKAEEMDND